MESSLHQREALARRPDSRECGTAAGNVVRTMATEPEPISDANLDRLAALTAQASPAPWVAFVGPGIGGDGFIRVGDDDAEPDMYVTRAGRPASPADLDLIAAARNSLPALIAEVRRARPGHANALRDSGKKPYLAVYDYGMGGIWIYVYAESADQIAARYPGLTVISEWREWMTPDRLIEIIAAIGPQMTFDIDQPDGWLAKSDETLRVPSDS